MIAEPNDELRAAECSCLEGEAPGDRAVAHVLLDSALPQLDHLFDYAIPDELRGRIRIGQRVRVPFRSQQRKAFGYVVAFAESSSFTGELSPVADIVSDVPLLTPDVWSLARAVADRAGGSACDILRLAIPGRQVRAEKRHLAEAASSASTSDADAPVPADADSSRHPAGAQRIAGSTPTPTFAPDPASDAIT